VWHLFVIAHPKRDQLSQLLRNQDIGTLIHYPIPPHLQEAYRSLNLKEGTLPIAEKMHREVLSLPISPVMSNEDVQKVISITNEACRALS
jgi:dTDP-4-amino-4,6-dideoxygalactose transaminase